jgi:hypothetical protein
MCLPVILCGGSNHLASAIPVGRKSLVSEPVMVVIAPCVNVVDFLLSGLAGSTFRHLG